MRRRLVNLLTAISLLLSAAAGALWVRGGGDQLIFTAGGRLWWVMFGEAGVHGVTVARWPGAERTRWMPRVLADTNEHIPTVAIVDPPPWTEWDRLGVHVRRGLVETWVDAGGAPASLATHLAEAPRGGPRRRSGLLRGTEVDVPYWMMVAAFGALPLGRAAAVSCRTLRRRRLAARQCCPACGYDLRATPGRCPECGFTPTAAKA